MPMGKYGPTALGFLGTSCMIILIQILIGPVLWRGIVAQKLLQRIAGASQRCHGGMSSLHLVITIIIITIIIITIIIAKNLIPQQPVNVGTEVEIMSVISSCLAQKQPMPSSKKNWFFTLIITSKLLLINICMIMNVIQKEPQRCLWRWRWRREREEQVKIISVLVSMHISPDSELKYLLQKEEFSGWKITSVEPFNDGNKGSEWSRHKKRARKRAQYFLWPRLSQLSTVIIKTQNKIDMKRGLFMKWAALPSWYLCH